VRQIWCREWGLAVQELGLKRLVRKATMHQGQVRIRPWGQQRIAQLPWTLRCLHWWWKGLGKGLADLTVTCYSSVHSRLVLAGSLQTTQVEVPLAVLMNICGSSWETSSNLHPLARQASA
jgi:hypothetical protein